MKRLEQLAHKFLKDETGDQRGSAINALRFFKSAENIQLLTRELTDQNALIRGEAYRVLKGWGVDVPAPPK
jgi:HEAT repeat protein